MREVYNISMKTIIFNPCTNEGVADPSLEEIKQLIQKEGEEYWSIDSGQSTLIYQNENLQKQLKIMYVEGYGFYLEYIKANTYYVTMSNDCFEDVAQVYVGGDPFPVPRALFLSIEETLKQVEEFFKTGEIDYSIKWIERNESGWNYGEDPNAGEYKEPVCESIEEHFIKHSKVKRKWMKEYEARKSIITQENKTDK